MIRIIITLAFIFTLFGCQSKNNTPGGTISEKEMRLIIADLMKADQFLANYAFKDTVSDKIQERYKLYQQVLDIHHVSKDNFWKSFSYYKKNPGQFGELMESIQKILSPAILPSDKINKRKLTDIDTVTNLPTIEADTKEEIK